MCQIVGILKMRQQQMFNKAVFWATASTMAKFTMGWMSKIGSDFLVDNPSDIIVSMSVFPLNQHPASINDVIVLNGFMGSDAQSVLVISIVLKDMILVIYSDVYFVLDDYSEPFHFRKVFSYLLTQVGRFPDHVELIFNPRVLLMLHFLAIFCNKLFQRRMPDLLDFWIRKV